MSDERPTPDATPSPPPPPPPPPPTEPLAELAEPEAPETVPLPAPPEAAAAGHADETVPLAEPPVELPAVEDITFAQPAPRAPVEPPAPAYTPRALSAKRYATLAAFAEALLPGVGAGSSARALEVPRSIDAWLAASDDETRTRFRRALTVIEYATLLGRAVRPFSRLGPGVAPAAAARARRARWRGLRQASAMVADACLTQAAAAPEVERRIGFDYGCVDPGPPNASAPLEVLSFPQIHRDHVETCDVVIVGSGAGGSVVAAELAANGLSVVVIEEGGLHLRDDLAGAPVDRARRLFREAGATVAAGAPDVQVPLGIGLGGSTTVGYGSAYRAPDGVLLHWEKELGIPDVDGSSMRAAFDRVEQALGVRPVPTELLGPMTPRIRDAARRLGAHGGTIRRTIDGCRGCGTCTVGCPSEAKLGAHLTFLPLAQRAGASIFANARVEHILVEEGRARGVVATLMEQRTRKPKARLRVEARAVVLAAGAVHTPALLLRNALGNRSGMVGRNLSLNPSLDVFGVFDDDLRSWQGTQQPFALDEWLEAHGLMLELTSVLPSADAGLLPGAGRALRDRLDRIGHLAAIRVSAADDGTGTVRAPAEGEPALSYRLSERTAARLTRGVGEAAELLFAAGAREVLTGLTPEPITTEAQMKDLAAGGVPAWARVRSLAPSGSARMGIDPSSAVVDARGAVHGVEGLWVADASLLPTCIGVAPQITVMAFAMRTAEHLLRDTPSI